MRDVSEVEGVQDLVRDLLAEYFVCLDYVAIEAVRTQALVEVAGLDGIGDVRESEELLQLTVSYSCYRKLVYHCLLHDHFLFFISHPLVLMYFCANHTLVCISKPSKLPHHVCRSLVYLLEVVSDLLIY